MYIENPCSNFNSAHSHLIRPLVGFIDTTLNWIFCSQIFWINSPGRPVYIKKYSKPDFIFWGYLYLFSVLLMYFLSFVSILILYRTFFIVSDDTLFYQCNLLNNKVIIITPCILNTQRAGPFIVAPIWFDNKQNLWY